MGIYRMVWRSGMGAVAAVGAVFAVLDLPEDLLLALGVCAMVLGASAAAVIRAGTRSALASSGALSASAVAVLCTFAVAGLLTLLGSAALLEVGLLGVLSPRMLGRFGVSAPAPAHPGGDRGAEAGTRRRTAPGSATTSCACAGAVVSSPCNTRCCPVSGSTWSRPALRCWRSSPTATRRSSPAGSTAPAPPAPPHPPSPPPPPKAHRQTLPTATNHHDPCASVLWETRALTAAAARSDSGGDDHVAAQ